MQNGQNTVPPCLFIKVRHDGCILMTEQPKRSKKACPFYPARRRTGVRRAVSFGCSKQKSQHVSCWLLILRSVAKDAVFPLRF